MTARPIETRSMNYLRAVSHTTTRDSQVSGYTSSTNSTAITVACAAVILTDSKNSNMESLPDGAIANALATAIKRTLVVGNGTSPRTSLRLAQRSAGLQDPRGFHCHRLISTLPPRRRRVAVDSKPLNSFGRWIIGNCVVPCQHISRSDLRVHW